jgi:hypothetical protein
MHIPFGGHGVRAREQGWFITVMPLQRSIASRSDVYFSSFTTLEVYA